MKTITLEDFTLENKTFDLSTINVSITDKAQIKQGDYLFKAVRGGFSICIVEKVNRKNMTVKTAYGNPNWSAYSLMELSFPISDVLNNDSYLLRAKN